MAHFVKGKKIKEWPHTICAIGLAVSIFDPSRHRSGESFNRWQKTTPKIIVLSGDGKSHLINIMRETIYILQGVHCNCFPMLRSQDIKFSLWGKSYFFLKKFPGIFYKQCDLFCPILMARAIVICLCEPF